MATPIARIITGWLCAGLMLLAAGCGGESSSPIRSPQDAVREKLRQEVSLWVFHEPLADALTRIGREYGVDIQIDEPALKSRSISPNQDVSLHVTKIQLSSALHHLLLGAGLSYDLDGSVVRVTYADDLDNLSLGHVYPVADITGHEIDLDEERLAEVVREVCPSHPLTSALSKRLTGPPPPSAHDGIVTNPGVLVVSRPPLAHEEIARLLEDMRQLATPMQTAPQRKSTAAEAAIVAALDTPISVDYLEKPLVDIRRELADQHGINILFNRAALLDAGIMPRDTLVTLRFKPRQLPLRAVLRLILRELGLGFTIRHECLLITSKDDLDQLLETRLYSTRGLPDPEQGVTAQALAKVLRNAVEPDAWQETGGIALLRVVRGGLLAHAPQDTHQQITEFLAQLRRATDPGVLDYTPFPNNPAAAWIEAKLAERTDLIFDETPLSAVADYFTQRHGVPILFNRRALEDAGIVPEDVLITRQLKGISLRAGLQAVLEELGLDFIIERSQRALIITSRDDAEERLTVRMHRVGGMVNAATGLSADHLIEMIEQMDITNLGSWLNSGGRGLSQVLGDVLIVVQNDRGHRSTKQHLDLLSRCLAEPPVVGLTVECLPRDPNEEWLERKLAEPVELALHEDPLTSLVQRLRERHKLPILFNRRALEDAGIVPEDTLITCSMKGPSLRAALSVVLDDLGLGFILQPTMRALMITAKEDADWQHSTRFYRVPKVVVGSNGVTSDRLVYLIARIIAPQRWRTFDDTGRHDAVGTTVVVHETYREHRETRQFLEALARFLGDPASEDVTVGVDAASDVKLQTALNEPTTLHVKDRSLSDVIDRLRQLHPDIHVDFNRRALKDAGIVPERRDAQLEVTDVPLRRVLTHLCDQHRMGWVIQHGVIVLTSKKDAAQTMTPFTIYRLPPRLTAEMSQEDVAAMIYDHVPGTWGDGAGFGVAEPIPGGIIVVNGEPSARKAKRFLDKLRAKFDPAGHR